MTQDPAATPTADAIPVLTPGTVAMRPLNEHLWALLTKAEPLTPEEWRYVEAIEMAYSDC